MKTVFKRTVSLVLAAVMAALTLTSCGKAYDKAMKKAYKSLEEEAYTVEVELDFDCADKEVAGIFEQLEETSTKLYFKDGRFKAENRLEITVGGATNSFSTVYTAVDSVLYSHMVASGSQIRDVKVKAAADDTDVARLAKDLCFVGDLSTGDFGKSAESKVGLETFAVYTDASDSAKIMLEKAMSELLEGAGTNIKLIDVRFTVETDDGRYDNATVDCKYEITIKEKVYTVYAEIELDFDFDTRFEIEAPVDADSYGVTDLENIIV